MVAVTSQTSGSTDSVSRDELRAIVNEALAGMDTAASQNAAIADDDPFLGPEDSSIVIVEFSDFNCGFCTRFAQDTLPQILENYGDQVKFVYRDMPILTETSAPAAQAGQCAAEQDAFWEFHDLMFTDSSARNRDAYIKFATDNNLDVAQFTECIDSGKYSGEVTLDLIDGQSLGVRGTPAFFINGRFISGAQPYEIFSTVIEAELAKSSATGG
jgi:protein-disulfide isomerase